MKKKLTNIYSLKNKYPFYPFNPDTKEVFVYENGYFLQVLEDNSFYFVTYLIEDEVETKKEFTGGNLSTMEEIIKDMWKKNYQKN